MVMESFVVSCEHANISYKAPNKKAETFFMVSGGD